MKRIVSWFSAVVMFLSLTACGEAGKLHDADIGVANLATAPVYPRKIPFDDLEKRRELRESNPISQATVNAIN